jgi:GNAT superfamily N-acetyltransferase
LNYAGLTFRLARRIDEANVNLIAVEAFARWTSVLGREPLPMRMDYGDAIAKQQVVIAEESSVPLGFIKTYRIGSDLFLDVLAVLPKVSGRGIGTALLREAERIAKIGGMTHVALKTVALYESNIAFYRSRGYSIVDTSTFDGKPILHFRKSLEREVDL